MPRDQREPGVRRSQLGSDGGVDDPSERQGCENVDVVRRSCPIGQRERGSRVNQEFVSLGVLAAKGKKS